MSVYYSHSVVPGGLDVRSYKTREIPGTVDISVTIFFTTCKKHTIEVNYFQLDVQFFFFYLTYLANMCDNNLMNTERD